MARKLMFFLKPKTEWRLAFKAALVSAPLFFIFYFGPAFIKIAVFLAVSFYAYASSYPDKKKIWFSFAVSCVLGFLGTIFIDGTILFLFGLLVFAAVLFGLMGLATLFFKDRLKAYGFFNTAVILGCFFFAFELGVYQGSIKIIIPVLFLLLFGIFSEFLSFSGVAFGKRGLVMAAAGALIGAEIYFLLSFLPLGSVNAAVFSSLIFVLGREGALAYHDGKFNARLGLRLLIFFLLFAVFIFASSRWSI